MGVYESDFCLSSKDVREHVCGLIINKYKKFPHVIQPELRKKQFFVAENNIIGVSANKVTKILNKYFLSFSINFQKKL